MGLFLAALAALVLGRPGALDGTGIFFSPLTAGRANFFGEFVMVDRAAVAVLLAGFATGWKEAIPLLAVLVVIEWMEAEQVGAGALLDCSCKLYTITVRQSWRTPR